MQNLNLFWSGLATIASKRFDRDSLSPGEYPIRYRLSASIGSEKIVETLDGSLKVSGNQSVSTSVKPKAEDLVAALLYRMSDRKRKEIISSVLSKGMVTDPASEQHAKSVLAALTTHSTSSKRGSLAFDVS